MCLPNTRESVDTSQDTISEGSTCTSQGEEADIVWRAKWLADGCNTLLEISVRLREEADRLSQMHATGHILQSPVEDDYAFIKSTS